MKILQDILIGDDSKNKQVIFNYIASVSVAIIGIFTVFVAGIIKKEKRKKKRKRGREEKEGKEEERGGEGGEDWVI